MVWLVAAGSLMTVAGLAMLGYCIFAAIAARKAGLDDALLRARLQRVLTLNLGALMLSALGLICVATGVFLS